MVHASSSLNAIRRPVVGLEVASRRPDRGRIVGPLRTASIALKRPFLGPPPNSDGIATTSTFSGRRHSSPIPRRSVRDGLGLTDRGRFFLRRRAGRVASDRRVSRCPWTWPQCTCVAPRPTGPPQNAQTSAVSGLSPLSELFAVEQSAFSCIQGGRPLGDRTTW